MSPVLVAVTRTPPLQKKQSKQKKKSKLKPTVSSWLMDLGKFWPQFLKIWLPTSDGGNKGQGAQPPWELQTEWFCS